MPAPFLRRLHLVALAAISAVYLHNTLPHLTMLPRVNVDEPWLMERAYEVMTTGVPSQPMLGLKTAYLLQVGYGYLFAPWLAVFGVGLLQARLLTVLLGLGAIWCVALVGRRSITPVAGLAAALFLATDSNFLGGARTARTDMPSVFFVAAALAAYVAARRSGRLWQFALSGACVGAAMLVHGNAFWVGLILLAWYLLDYGLAGVVRSYGYVFIGGMLVTFGPYLAVVLTRWRDVQLQIGNFAGDRVPAWQPAIIWREMALEIGRYRGWYFGLVTSEVPNPLLWLFQAATLAGVLLSVVRLFVGQSRSHADPKGPARLLILAAGSAFIFAAFINNKVPVYLPHLLLGFALAAGFAVSEIGEMLPGRDVLVPTLLSVFALAGVAYYEKWYSSARKSELVPYEETVATLRALVPPGAKYIYGSPQFWTPFHAEPETTFYSFAEDEPHDDGEAVTLRGADGTRAVVLLVDEVQWLPELTAGVSQPPVAWQKNWIAFIRKRCALDRVAYGTAHGTIAAYRCVLHGEPPTETPKLIAGSTEVQADDVVLSQSATDLARWTRYDDPRRTSVSQPRVDLIDQGLRISGTGWPGIIKMFDASPGDAYLVRTDTSMTRDGDLLYLGTWQQPQVRSLSGASSSGIPAPLVAEPWFPRDRAFVATAPQVRVALYSESPATDFIVSSLQIIRLRPVAGAATAGAR